MESNKGQTDRNSDIYISLSVNYIRLRLIKFRLIRLDRGHKILVSTADIALCQSLSQWTETELSHLNIKYTENMFLVKL